MKIALFTKASIMIIAFVCIASSCDKFNDESPLIGEESVKEIQGNWKIAKVSRNGTDITNQMDFSLFRLKLNENKTYSTDNYLPFLVREDGTWNIDDPQYPFTIIFKENGASESLVSNLSFPATGGKRAIKLTFSPGCPSNVYTYEFEKVSNQ